MNSADPLSTRTATVSSAPDGVVRVRIHKGKRQTLEDAEANINAAIVKCGGRRCPILVDISVGEPLEPRVRHYYSGDKLGEFFAAIAVLAAANPFGRMMGNIYLRVAKPGVPIQLFATEDEAIRWLLEHRA